MKEQGADPDKGYKVVLPFRFKDELSWGQFGPPNYMSFSKLATEPLFYKDILSFSLRFNSYEVQG